MLKILLSPDRLYDYERFDTDNDLYVKGHNGLDVEYNVWYRERLDSEWRTMKILSRGVTDATVIGLQPATEYELRVLSQDHIGDGLFSKPIFVRTLGKYKNYLCTPSAYTCIKCNATIGGSISTRGN